MVEVPPRFELGSLDSESRVLTITPWNPTLYAYHCIFFVAGSSQYIQTQVWHVCF